MTSPAATETAWLGRMEYRAAWRLQLDTVGRRARDEIPDTLLLVEHDSVFTVGRRCVAAHAPPRSLGVPIVEVERGGDYTWHGPGQLVGYWIRKLEGTDRDLHRHLRLIEERLVESLADFGIEAGRREGLTGVWVDDGARKIASIGVAVRRWVTYHGFALNVRVPSEAWTAFAPCGLESSVMTDMTRMKPTGSGTPAIDEIARHIAVCWE